MAGSFKIPGAHQPNLKYKHAHGIRSTVITHYKYKSSVVECVNANLPPSIIETLSAELIFLKTTSANPHLCSFLDSSRSAMETFYFIYS